MDYKQEKPVKAEPLSRSPSASSHSPSPADPPLSLHRQIFSNSPSFPSVKSPNDTPRTPDLKESVIGAEFTVDMESGKAPKLSRTSSKKVVSRPPTLFDHEPDAYEEATSVFSVIEDCIYANKYMGSTEAALECDCQEEWDSSRRCNDACGEDSDCINRATKMECIDDCSCGSVCQNMRFQRKEFAKVTVFKTEKKGYGLRADTDLRPSQFIFEYIGEVINEPSFRRRTRQYDDEGIKHFYFMSLNKGEFIDATRKGNLGRFCNHSCNPNCYVDKWVVGDKLRMGIFAERQIKAGEELVFNYNVDRYGADPQPCYCGEPNCTGYIGGKTQTESGTKLSNATIEALGIDDYDDWEFAVPKKPKKARKTEEHDEEYVNNVQPKSLEEDGVTKVMAALMQCKEKWIAVKLLGRIQRSDDLTVMNRVVRMHGYRILKTALGTFIEDANVCLQVLDILFKLPRITRNKIQDSGIEDTVSGLKDSEDARVVAQAAEILDIWSQLEVAYRIPRMKRDPNAVAARNDRAGRRDVRERSKSPEKKAPIAPTGPKNNVPQRAAFNGPRPSFRSRPFVPLPKGWFQAVDNGRTYYYTSAGQTTWTRPTEAVNIPSAATKQVSHEERLQQIINNITKNANTPKDSATPSASIKDDEPLTSPKEEKWRSYPEGKQKTIYENTVCIRQLFAECIFLIWRQLFPHIKHVLDKYKNKLPREDLKRFGKEISKKLVASDYKNGRVSDPTKVSSKHATSVKKYVKEFFDKAVKKHRAHELAKSQSQTPKASVNGNGSHTPSDAATHQTLAAQGAEDDEVVITEDEASDDDQADSAERKRKRGTSPNSRKSLEQSLETLKRAKTDEAEEVAPDPPPPPPMELDALMPSGDANTQEYPPESGMNGAQHEVRVP